MDIRAEMHQLMVETLADEAKHHCWTYDEIRPLRVPPAWAPGMAVIGDCSKGVQYICKWSGAPDPMGNDFADWGNSTTICLNLHHLSHPSDMLVGDVVTVGPGGDEHAALCMEAGADPLLWSFGHPGAPNTYRASWDKRPQQFLRLPVPALPPTPGAKLRARKGYFAWVAWKQGEGDWKKYGKANGSVRPNVPRNIPMTWWKRYAMFLKNRNHGNKATLVIKEA